MDIKGGTQTWSKSAQTSSLKTDPKQTLGALDQIKALGDEKDLGQLLNKIADPNWVDPAKTRQVGNPELGKDAFLKLLLAQMKNQDPTSPMESHEMSAQLAQFSSLESLQNIDRNMKVMANPADKNNASQFELMNMIGKAVMGDSSQILRQDPTEEHDINFKLIKDAENVKLTIKDKLGTVIRELEVKGLKEGQNKVSWNGLNKDGVAMGSGEYRVELKALDSGGRKIAAETKFAGVVTGVNFSAEGPVLLMGKQKIRMKNIKSITTPDQIAKVANHKVNNEIKKSSDDVVESKTHQAVLDNVAMSRGIINKLSKETR